VYETLKFAYLPFSFTYPVTVEQSIEESTVIITATAFKLTRITMTFKLKKNNDFTIVEENLQIKSPLPLKNIMQGILKRQHKKLFKNIELRQNHR